METRLFFVRHAEPNYNNHNDLMRELSDKGMRDRKLVTAFLPDKEIDLAVSSPFNRAVEFVFCEEMQCGKIRMHDLY